jgi:hypothetical protein
MYPLYFLIGYLVLFLAIPIVWALGGAWRRARVPRLVRCPGRGTSELVSFDAGFAVRRHAAGEDTELRVAACTAWPERSGCDRGCV